MIELDLDTHKLTQKERVLAMLKASPKTTADFCSTWGLAAEYRARISDLRNDGHNIVATKITRSNYKYELIEH